MSERKQNSKALVIVESPLKAKKIGEFLGRNYIVLASRGHVRDLPASAKDIPEEFKKESWATLGVNVDQSFNPLYVIPPEKKSLIKEIRDALKDADELILATDEDREGESIGWHLRELLKPKVPVRRMVFSEVTKTAILNALQNTRDLDANLVEAQETRRVVDRLYGYRLSPLLWKKIAKGLSAGRVQSVAVRLLVQREIERLAFRKGTYWDLEAKLGVSRGGSLIAQLYSVQGKRVASGRDFDERTGQLKADADVVLLDEAAATALVNRLSPLDWRVASIETRDATRKPYPPFTTSTLQQEANRKLSMTARETMQVAQRLYENGYITYMRTDSVNLSQEAIQAARDCVKSRYGQEYLHGEVRRYANKNKSAQEAHEAIRPAGTEMQTAEELGLSGREAVLYAMIWKRTVATQMAEAKLKFQTATIMAADAEFRATGRHVEFPGFFRAYVEGVDDPEAAMDDQEANLPPLIENESLACQLVKPLPHETKPPARFTEATLVGELEADGIGRPSTYASIIGTVQDRGYVRKSGNQLVPTFTALAVTRLLERYFPNLVDYKFTAKMEQTLDDIASGEAERLPYLQQFFSGEGGLDNQVKVKEEAIDPREACTLELEGLGPKIRVGRYGPYLETERSGEMVTASLPADISPADLTDELADKLIQLKQQGPQSLGRDPESGLDIFLLVGPFGPYLQVGQVSDMEEGSKPRRVSIPKNRDPSTLTLEDAQKYLSLPRALGPHPVTGHVVKAGIGMYGPYVLHEKVYKSLGKEDDILTIGLDRAVELLAQAKTRGAQLPLREIGKHPTDGESIGVFEGRYGMYVKHGKVNATIPKDADFNAITLEEAIKLLEERAAKGGTSGRGRRGAKKAAPARKKAAVKKKSGTASEATSKKAPAKKSGTKKAAKKKAAKKS